MVRERDFDEGLEGDAEVVLDKGGRPLPAATKHISGARPAIVDGRRYALFGRPTERPAEGDAGEPLHLTAALQADGAAMNDGDWEALAERVGKEGVVDDGDDLEKTVVEGRGILPPREPLALSSADPEVDEISRYAKMSLDLSGAGGEQPLGSNLPTTPMFSKRSRLHMEAYLTNARLMEEHDPRNLIRWWLSEDPLERLWGQLNCALVLLTDKCITDDIKVVLGKGITEVMVHGLDLAGLRFTNGVQKDTLIGMIRAHYPASRLNAIIKDSA